MLKIQLIKHLNFLLLHSDTINALMAHITNESDEWEFLEAFHILSPLERQQYWAPHWTAQEAICPGHWCLLSKLRPIIANIQFVYLCKTLYIIDISVRSITIHANLYIGNWAVLRLKDSCINHSIMWPVQRWTPATSYTLYNYIIRFCLCMSFNF